MNLRSALIMINKIFFLAFFLHISIQAVHELGSYGRCEDINGIMFKQKLFFDDNEIMRDFFIDNEQVVQEVFEQKRHDATECEVQIAQQRLKNMVAHEEDAFERLRVQGYLKLIKHARELLDTLLVQIYEEHMRPFWIFNESNISSEELLYRLKQHLHPSLAFVDDADAEKESVSTLRSLFEKLEQLCQALAQFYQQAMAWALEHSDDPGALKKLLELKE